MKKHETGKKMPRELIVGLPMMLVALIVIFLILPLGMMAGPAFIQTIRDAGVKLSPNFDDGYLIADFSGTVEERCLNSALHEMVCQAPFRLTGFMVKKIEFRSTSGAGFAPRINLVLVFTATQDSDARAFPPPGLYAHFYIDSPAKKDPSSAASAISGCIFPQSPYDFLVIADLSGSKAEIFDSSGNKIGDALGVYINPEWEYRSNGSGPPTHTVANYRITVALPLRALGEPSRGDWDYYVFTSTSDGNGRSGTDLLSSSSVCDSLQIIVPAKSGAEIGDADIPVALPPLHVSGRSK